MSNIDTLKSTRLEKLDTLRGLGITPYPGTNGRTHTVAAARDVIGSSVTVTGRVMSRRGHGKIVFFDLVDETGKIQVVMKADKMPESRFKLLESMDLGDFWETRGLVGKTEAGELSVFAEDISILSKALRPLPDKWYGFDDVEERYRQRYVDLIVNDDVKKVFLTRSRVVKFIRNFLDKDGFVEVETPVLQPLYGGASAKPFITHHNALDMDLYLRIAVELYLKRLIVGGFEKVYEIGKDFRNEGIDRQHNPEFTMVEFYWAYADYNKLMEYTEQMISGVVKEIKGTTELTYQGKQLQFQAPYPRLPYRDVVLEYTGIDIDIADTDAKLVAAIKEKNLKLDMDGLIGYGAILDELYKTYARPHLLGPLFLINRPTAFVSLAKRLPTDERYTSSFQLLVDGKEVLNAYNELNDPIDQAKRWHESEELGKKGQLEYEEFDSDYIRALEYGMPPTAGWGMGIDRLVSILTDQASLKDVILFPTLRPEQSGDKSENRNTKSETPEKEKKTEVSSQMESKKPLGPVSHDDDGKAIAYDTAMKIVTDNTKNPGLIKHMIAVEVAMRAYAKHFGADQELWGVTGLLHDADYEMFKDDAKLHPSKIFDILKEHNAPQSMVDAISAHAYGWKEQCKAPETQFEWSLYGCDELTGLITACALVRPEKKLDQVELSSVMKKWKVPSFAAGVVRKNTEEAAEKLGMTLEEFITIALDAMKAEHEKLGL
jgi:lysyl-tRNA synthetase class 2